MSNKPIAPEDVIGEESEPPITEVEEPPKEDPGEVEVDIDDAQIEEPRDDAFRNPPKKTRGRNDPRTAAV